MVSVSPGARLDPYEIQGAIGPVKVLPARLAVECVR